MINYILKRENHILLNSKYSIMYNKCLNTICNKYGVVNRYKLASQLTRLAQLRICP